MIRSHSSINTLSQNIRPYLSKGDKNGLSKLPNREDSGEQAVQALKSQLKNKTKSIKKLIGFLEDLTWLNVPDELTKNAILDLIKIAKGFYVEERKYSNSLQAVRIREINTYLHSLEDLEETIQDVESAIITLPKLDGFKDTFDELARL